jgi:RNA polymerase sigma-70 factor (ECF subfamily)
MEQVERLELGPPTTRPLSRDAVLSAVFAASYRRLVVQLYGVVGDASEAEDLVQEAFVRASAAGRRFTRVDNHEAWLRTTALNLHRNRFRKLRNFGKVRPALAHGPVDLPALDEHLVVVEALRALPEAQREVVVLRYLADLQVSDVAAELGIPEGTVKSRLNRALAALAGDLTEEDDDV